MSTDAVVSELSCFSARIIRELKQYQNEVETIPEGKLYTRYKNNSPYFSERCNSNVKGITRKTDRVYELARRTYLLLLINLLQFILDKGCQSLYDSLFLEKVSRIKQLLSSYEKSGLNIERIIFTRNQLIWNSNRQSQSNFHVEALRYSTSGGIRMRSKSEQLIGTILELLGIPYRYEPSLIINGIVYHPDFVIMLPDNRLIIIEHAGRMDLENYNDRLISRLQAYDYAGLHIGCNVFLTFENDTRSDKLVKEILMKIYVSDAKENRHLTRMATDAGCNM